jgi:hypothetical protein
VHPPAGFVAQVSSAVQWAAAELQKEAAATPRHTWLRHLGKILLAASSICFGLQDDLRSQPGYWQMLLPAGQLAWMLLEAEQQAAAAESSSGGSIGARRGGDIALPSQQLKQQMQMQPVDGVPGAVLEFLQVYGVAVYTGLPRAQKPVIEQLCSSAEVFQLLLAFTALSVGAAHKLIAAAAPKAASRHSSSSSSSSSTMHRSKHSSTAAAAAGNPASHLDLLAAVSPPLHKLISRQHARTHTAGDYGSFKRDSAEQAQHYARLVAPGIYTLYKLRDEFIRGGDVVTSLLAAVAADHAAFTAISNNDNGGSSAFSSTRASAGDTAVPRQEQLLLPLLLTMMEYTQLMPEPRHGVIPSGVQLLTHIFTQQGPNSPLQLLDGTEASSSSAAAAEEGEEEAAATVATVAAASVAALADGLTAPLLLQLGPLALQYLRDAAAAATPGAAALEAALTRGSAAAAADQKSVSVVSRCLAGMVIKILAHGAGHRLRAYLSVHGCLAASMTHAYDVAKRL